MRPIEALPRLQALLTERGVPFSEADRETITGDGADWRTVWEAFCDLAREPADEPFTGLAGRLHVPDHVDNDLLLHESLAVGPNKDRFVVHLTRQFGFGDDEGEYAGMYALTLNIDCDRLPEGRVPRAQRWGYAGRKREDHGGRNPEFERWAGYVEAWAAAVEASNSFKALESLGPTSWRAAQGDM